MTSPGHVVVVGAGLAGLRTIEDLRGRGYAGPVTLVGAEPRLPYDRPPLSKKLMTGALDDTTLRPDLVVNLPGGLPPLAQCPKCGQASLIRAEGCDQCTSCDYSKCG